MKTFLWKFSILAGVAGVLLVGVKWVPFIWQQNILDAILITFLISHFILLSVAEYRETGDL